ITAGGLMFLSLGWTVGDFISVVPLSGISRDPLQLSIMTFVVFILCVIATFWVGSAYDVKRLWGLRRSHLPKEFHDIVLQRKCELLIKQHLLTRREGEVLSLLAAGKRPACIGKELHISSNTVRTHIQNTYVKMGVHSVEGINEALEATYVEASGVSCEVQPTES
ncbi:MAG: helix-turn-helix transcriptional regulator, partial [Gordonibacter sp.]|uniref:response regulator transcription factor n=1 Tax=Gordonibacter sp. TaxID=1968902 RepID=UPI002FC83BF7